MRLRFSSRSMIRACTGNLILPWRLWTLQMRRLRTPRYARRSSSLLMGDVGVAFPMHEWWSSGSSTDLERWCRYRLIRTHRTARHHETSIDKLHAEASQADDA